jgi:uroporphyrinogen decarboxylase
VRELIPLERLLLIAVHIVLHMPDGKRRQKNKCDPCCTIGIERCKGGVRKMDSRARVLTALKHQEPDRIPLDLGSLCSTIESLPYKNLVEYLDIESEVKTFVRDHVEPDPEILERFSIDTRYVRIRPPKGFTIEIRPDNSYVDEWGTTFRKPQTSLYYDPVPPYPLADATIADLEKYPWPDPHDPGRIEGLEDKARELYENTDCAIVADIPFLGPLEFAWLLLRGARFFEDLILDKTFARALLEKVADIHIQIFDRFLDAVGKYIHVVAVSDDLGDQDRPMMSPKLYREMVKPVHKRLWSFVKKKTDAFLFLHSCGSIYPLIPDLIEIGVDIINPVQVSAKDMDTARLKTEFGADLTFWGGIDTHRVMPKGSPDEVEAEVKRRIGDLAPGGGFVLTAVHNIQADVNPENICRMYDAAKRFGTYPITV